MIARAARKGAARAALAALLAAAGCLAARPAAAETPDLWAHGSLTVRTYDRDDGLPQVSINAVNVDVSGRLWVATNSGPAYHDGQRFRALVFPDSAMSPFVWSIAVPQDGSVWFGLGAGGVMRYAGGAFIHMGVDAGLPAIPAYAVLDVPAGGGYEIWVGTNRGLFRQQGDRFVRVEQETGNNEALVYTLLRGKLPSGEPTIWVGGQGLLHCEAARCAPLVVGGVEVAKKERVLSLLETADEQGRHLLWVGTESGLFRLTAGQWERVSEEGYAVPDAQITSLAETVSGSGKRVIWAGVKRRGLLRYSQGRWVMLTHERSGLPDNSINVLLAPPSSQGGRILWIGTEVAGLVKLRHEGWLGFSEQQTGQAGAAYGFAEVPGPTGLDILVGMANGVAKLSAQGWSWLDRDVPKGTSVLSVAPASQDGSLLWLATEEHGLHQLSTRGEPAPSPPLPLGRFRAINQISRSVDGRTLWAAADGGALRWDGAEWRSIWEEVPDGVGNSVRCSLEIVGPGDKKSLWFGTVGGLRVLRDGQWSRFTTKDSGLAGDYINGLSLLTDPDGRRVLWIGTDRGVSRYLVDSGQWLPSLGSCTSPALPDIEIYQVRGDAKGRVYLFTNDGVARLTYRKPTPEDAAEFSLYTFTTEDGLPSNECNQNGSFVDSLGRIWAGTIRGPAVFDPAEELPDDAAKPLVLVSSNAPSGPLSPGAALRWDQNTVAFEYALLSYFRERDTRYRVQLSGFDAAPGEWSADTKARYTNLPGGDYELRVWGRDAAGNVSGPLPLSFHVKTAPWQTWWAFIGYAAALAGLIYSGIRARVRALDRQNRELEGRIAERTRELHQRNRELDEAHAETEQKNVALDRKVSELAQKNRELEESHQRADRIFSALAVALPGTVLDDKYLLESQVGSGGFGMVFRARHLLLGRDVAVKVFRPAPGNDSAAALERFRKEGMTACRVIHPNAVQVFDSGISAQGIAYMVMELLSGVTLAEELEQNGALSLRRAARIITGICDALAAAHATGLLHRDIKPENIFLHQGAEGETVKVVDFGIAKLLGPDSSVVDRTATGIIGTPLYMAPERLRAGDYDERSDVYSVGVTCYEVLSGVSPYPVGDRPLAALVMDKLEKPPISMKDTAAWVPAEAAAAVTACMAIDPAERPGLDALSRTVAQAVASLSAEEQDRPRGKAARAVRAEAATVDAGAVDPTAATVHLSGTQEG